MKTYCHFNTRHQTVIQSNNKELSLLFTYCYYHCFYLSLLLVFSSTLQVIQIPVVLSFRIEGSTNEESPFLPYEKGFIDESGTIIPAIPAVVNQGYDEMIYHNEEYNKRLQSCPGMIGPLHDNKYYCLAKEYGYCDRRSGTCFCNEGYMGESCEECDPNHYRVGSLCYKRNLCPKHCSSAGKCDYVTGICKCNDFRDGNDCSTFKCSKFHSRHCISCNEDHCLQCSPGFSVNKEAPFGTQCEPCYRFDPRCSSCNMTHCLGCTDLLLQSIQRSGQRKDRDPELPLDEMERQYSVKVPFGSQQSDAFDEAEIFHIVDTHLVPLNESSIQCDQGVYGDSSFSCYPLQISNIVCGHQGVFSFTSPEYAVAEDAGHVRLTVRRSGGGAGKAQVSYSIEHVTTNDSDVTPTAHYATTQILSFSDHEVQKSFVITINNDLRWEGNETFGVFLYNPSGLSQLGNQWKTVVTIVDDDHGSLSTDENITTLTIEQSSTTSCFSLGNSTITGQQFKDEALFIVAESTQGYDLFSFFTIPIDYNGKKVYNLPSITTPGRGTYTMHVYRLSKGGLVGSYFTDLMLSKLEKTRVDANLNFTWSEYHIKSGRWDGLIVVNETKDECCTFYISGKNVRLWVNRYLVIDEWNHDLDTEVEFTGFYSLNPFDTTELMIEMRDIKFASSVTLMMSDNETTRSVVSPSKLLWKDEIASFEYSF